MIEACTYIAYLHASDPSLEAGKVRAEPVGSGVAGLTTRIICCPARAHLPASLRPAGAWDPLGPAGRKKVDRGASA